MTVIADAGAIFALVDANDRWHKPVVEWWRSNRDEVLIAEPAVTEICYFLQTRLGSKAELALIESIASGELETVALKTGDLQRAAELMREYSDLRIGFVDASIIAIAERLETKQILTTDRRHFGAIRPRHARSFSLLPAHQPGG